MKKSLELFQICCNASENGMLDDPRANYCSTVNTPCGFKSKFIKDQDKSLGSLAFPKVCGNCYWYSVQEGGGTLR